MGEVVGQLRQTITQRWVLPLFAHLVVDRPVAGQAAPMTGVGPFVAKGILTLHAALIAVVRASDQLLAPVLAQQFDRDGLRPLTRDAIGLGRLRRRSRSCARSAQAGRRPRWAYSCASWLLANTASAI